jgi:bla regulator protein blaR1
MILYFIKVILSSAFFLMLYKLLLQNERMLIFNRFYLLVALIISFFIPFITIETNTIPIAEIIENIETKNIINTSVLHENSGTKNDSNYLNLILITSYIAVSIFLLSRFGKNLKKVFQKIKYNKQVTYNKSTLVLCNDKNTAHSFFNYIFIQQNDFIENKIEPSILKHEATHVQQKHSLDIIFIELLQIIFWINPFIYLYKKVIKLNHEFLADANVVETYNNHYEYQNLLLTKASEKNAITLASEFNYLITKKRLIMITKNSTKTKMAIKIFSLIPMIAVLIFFISERTIAQVTNTDSTKTKQLFGNGASQELLNEYDSTIVKVVSIFKLKNGKTGRGVNVSKCNPDRMAYIFYEMTKEQQGERTNKTGIGWSKTRKSPTKKSPTKTEFNSYKNGNIYGVWIDGKRIENNKLSNYKESDFVLAYSSKLAKNAYNYGKHYYQVTLFTQSYYDEEFTKMENTAEIKFLPFNN